MPVFSHNLQKILIFDPDASRSSVSAFVDRPSEKSGESDYYIFMLTEIKNDEHENNLQTIHTLQNTFASFFRNADQRVTESLFEEGVHTLNKSIPQILADHNPDWLHGVNMVVGCVYGNSIHFSQSGSVTILYLHHGKIQDVADQKISQNVNPLKMFSEVVNGRLEEHDSLFVGTTNFLDYFSQEKIRRIIEEHAETSLSKAFDQYLLQAPTHTSFAAIHISQEPGDPINIDQLQISQKFMPQGATKIRSMEELIMREQATEEILTPRLWPAIKKLYRNATQNIKLALRKYILKKPTRISPIIEEQERLREEHGKIWRKPKQSFSRNSIFGQIRKIFLSLKNTGNKTGLAIQQAFKKITSRSKEDELAPQVRTSMPQKPFLAGKSFKNLPAKNRVILITLLIVLAAFAQSIVFIGMRNENKKQDEQITLSSQAIDNSIADISAGFLYGDDNRVQTAIQKLSAEIKNLPDSDKGKELAEKANVQIVEATKKLQRIREIMAPEQVADLAAMAPDGQIQTVAFFGNNLYSLIPQQKSIITTSLNGESILSTQGENASLPRHLTVLNGRLVLLNQDVSITEFAPTSKQFSKPTFSYTQDTTNISAIATYGNWLYAVDNAQNQVYRFARGGSAYGLAQPRIDAESDFTNVSSLAIDGSLYIGFENGEIQKYTQGDRVDFSVTKLSEPITKLAQLWTSESSNTLIGLDQSLKRILIFDKKGALKEQLQFPTLEGIQAFAVDEKNSVVYVLSGKKIFKASLIAE